MAETNIKDVKLKIGMEAQFQDKLKDLPINTLVGVTDPIQEDELDTSIINKLNKAENSLSKPANDSTGTAGQVLKKTEDGSEWGDATPTTFKTLFGNQSIVGSGNIDLYVHNIQIDGYIGLTSNTITIRFTKISSNNLVCNSLTDIGTLLGNDINISATGYVIYSGENNVIWGITGTNIASAHANLTTGKYIMLAQIQSIIVVDKVTTV